MKHYLNVCDVNGAEVDPVDVITFGSPCQDLSVAGKRTGLKHESKGDHKTTRSGLFMEAVRIIKEMRKKDESSVRRANEHVRPRFAVWENVCGAFSSNKGEDFRVVLEELSRISDETVSIPLPESGKWQPAGEIIGDGWSIAWRTLDAQYHGVPQRRRRIFLVADFADECAGEILFECKGLPGYPPESCEAWEGTARDIKNSVGGTGERECVVPYTLQIRSGCEGGGKGPLIQTDKSACLTAAQTQTLFQPVPYGIGSYNSEGMKSDNPHSGFYEADTARTLDLNGGNPACNQGGIAICDKYDSKYIVRRLTPTECARLQGMPDEWCNLSQIDYMSDEEYEFWKQAQKTHAEINGKKYREKSKKQMIAWYNKLRIDGAEYKAYGNGMALPCVRVPIHGIAKKGAKTMGSLFDGIGGFPLAGLMDGIQTLWTSEIELFPIAVTKERFGEYEKYGGFTFGQKIFNHN